MPRTTFLLERSDEGKWCTLRSKHPDLSCASVGCCANSSYPTLKAAVSRIKASDLDDPDVVQIQSYIKEPTDKNFCSMCGGSFTAGCPSVLPGILKKHHC